MQTLLPPQLEMYRYFCATHASISLRHSSMSNLNGALMPQLRFSMGLLIAGMARVEAENNFPSNRECGHGPRPHRRSYLLQSPLFTPLGNLENVTVLLLTISK